MATYTATAAQANAPALYGVNRDITRHVTFSLGAVPTLSAAGDVIQMLKVPVGAIVSRVVVGINGHTGVATVNIGYGGDISLFGASVVLSGSAVALTAIPFRGLGYTFTAEDTIDIQCAAVSANSAVGALYLGVTYSNQN